MLVMVLWSPPLYTGVDRVRGVLGELVLSTLCRGVPELKNLGLQASTTTRSK